MSKKFIITKEGLSSLKEEYDLLVKKEKPEVIARINRAREFGDLSENSEYDAAKEEQSLIETRIEQLEDVIQSYQIIDTTQKSDFVMIGSTVVVQSDGEKDEFKIVGTVEADPARRMISNESPVGASLLGAKVGEEVEVNTSIVKAKYKILEIK